MSPHDYVLALHVRHLVDDHGLRPSDVALALGLDASTIRWALSVRLDDDVYEVGHFGHLRRVDEHREARPRRSVAWHVAWALAIVLFMGVVAAAMSVVSIAVDLEAIAEVYE